MLMALVDRGYCHIISTLIIKTYDLMVPAKLQDEVRVIMKVIDLMPCREAGWGGGGRILLMFQTA